MANIKDVPTLTYCTPDDVADALDLPDLHDLNGKLTFSNVSHPSYDQVCRMIASNEGRIDRLLRRTWRENVNDPNGQVLTLNSYWHDLNGWRNDYYAEGGDYIQLRKDVRSWDPFPKYVYSTVNGVIQTENATDSEGDQIYISTDDPQFLVDNDFFWTKARKSDGTLINTNGIQDFVLVSSIIGTGTFVAVKTPIVSSTTYEGDMLKMRSRSNQWTDMSYVPLDGNDGDGMNSNIWFDYQHGKMYIRTRLYQQRYNAIRVRYRYGAEESVPDAIVRMCALMTAINVISMQYYNVKLGSGGDLGNTREATIKQWTDEINDIKSAYQRSGSVHSMYR